MAEGIIIPDINPHIKARQGNPVGSKGSQEQAKESQNSVVRSPTKTSSQKHKVYAEDLAQAHAGFTIAIAVSVGPHEPA